MNFYATLKHHSTTGYWEKLTAKTLSSAKREATARFGGGYIGHEIHLAASEDTSRLNDLPVWVKVISIKSKWRYQD